MIPTARLAGLAVAVLAVGALVPGGFAEATPNASRQAVEGQGPAPVAVTLTPVIELDAPMAMVPRHGTPDLYVAERAGLVRRLDASPDGLSFTAVSAPVLDITDRTTTSDERGLLGLVFSPDGKKLYVHFTNLGGDTRLVEYTMLGGRADLGSRRTLLRVAQPFPNHNGGQVAFGPDGRLYLGLGDGGSGGDPFGNGQNTSVLLGKVLRIDPTPAGARPYRVPLSNPFVAGGPAGADTRPEIWMYGLRNPWRFSFDRLTGALWLADVGQDSFEEIDKLPRGRTGRNPGRGANLGWAQMEGTQPYAGGTEPANHSRPIFTYPHGLNNQNGCAITGGYVYRGSRIPALNGTYLYGDLCKARVRGLVQRHGQVSDERDLGIGLTGAALIGFAEDGHGEVYTLGDNGTVSRIDPA